MSRTTYQLRRVLALACSMGLVACANPGMPAVGSPTSSTAPLEPDATWVGVLTRKGNTPFQWWALQTDAGQVWQLELPAPIPSQALESRQNCRVRASGEPAEGLLGARLLRLDRLSGVPDPALGAPENQRCQFSLTVP